MKKWKENLIQSLIWLFWITFISSFLLTIITMIAVQYGYGIDSAFLPENPQKGLICLEELGRSFYEKCSFGQWIFQIFFFWIASIFADPFYFILTWPTLIIGIILFASLYFLKYEEGKKVQWRRWVLLLFPLLHAGVWVLMNGMPQP